MAGNGRTLSTNTSSPPSTPKRPTKPVSAELTRTNRLYGVYDANKGWLCNCAPTRLRARLQRCQRGEHTGRWFIACPKDRSSACNFFCWKDDERTRAREAGECSPEAGSTRARPPLPSRRPNFQDKPGKRPRYNSPEDGEEDSQIERALTPTTPTKRSRMEANIGPTPRRVGGSAAIIPRPRLACQKLRIQENDDDVFIRGPRRNMFFDQAQTRVVEDSIALTPGGSTRRGDSSDKMATGAGCGNIEPIPVGATRESRWINRNTPVLTHNALNILARSGWKPQCRAEDELRVLLDTYVKWAEGIVQGKSYVQHRLRAVLDDNAGLSKQIEEGRSREELFLKENTELRTKLEESQARIQELDRELTRKNLELLHLTEPNY
ncbi:hypothetical protein BDZ91DRAFT_848318 [Kalaharituber pfeilii]|nr:hypothetical protein BDZ91DRAFT_848318 [Kalaharituber pfeilii]